MTYRRFIPHALILALVLVALAAGGAAAYAAPLPDDDEEYNSAGFIVRHVWQKFAWVAGEPFRDDLTRHEEDARIERFFELNRLIAEGERTAGDPAATPDTVAAARDDLRRLRDERAEIENTVERIIEGRLTRIAKEHGLVRRLGRDIVWPPVSIEFEDPPAVLVRSPRDVIRNDDESLLQGSLPIERLQRIEERAERDGETSALVVNIGGIAMYPAIVPPTQNYGAALEHIAHEWMHHYLYFAPLGRRYYDSDRLTTLNETVANIAGRELGEALLAAYPLPEREVRTQAESPDNASVTQFDFAAEMRTLRIDVERLLAAGMVEEAETWMEKTREFLAENGYYIRRLNQAYFAFHGSYADTPGSIDPIGPKLATLREESGSLEAFVERARELTSEVDLDEALAPTATP